MKEITDLFHGFKALSVTSIAKKLNMTRKSVRFHMNQTDNFTQVDPLTIGSCKSKLEVYTLKQQQ